ncbi:hypothetical protein CANMA_001189 [Candida margitis]|uniref:uncharacterized protein n=1 Tax=Candida margitis TaxID=1775924 RepID=UPI002225FF17|nr:uncharacterized protein CANMA_001189 [Candida margitis]KAI5969727.1 hypothetical protein CANMA_001189 [Candida margitis]
MANYNEVQPTAFKPKNSNKRRGRNHGGGNNGGGGAAGGSGGRREGGGNNRRNNREGGGGGDNLSSGNGRSFKEGGFNHGNRNNGVYEREENSNQNYTPDSTSFTETSYSHDEYTFGEDGYDSQRASSPKVEPQSQPTSYTQISRRDTRNDPIPVKSSYNSQPTHSRNSTRRYSNTSPKRPSINNAEAHNEQPQPPQTHQPNNNDNFPPSFRPFVERKLVAIGNLSPRDQAEAKEQLAILITSAQNRELMFINDWAKQKIPLLDGGGEMLLQCEEENASNRNRTTSDGVSGGSSRYGGSRNQNNHQTVNMTTRYTTSTKEPISPPQRESAVDRIPLDGGADVAPINAESSTFMRGKPQKSFGSAQDGDIPRQAKPYAAVNSKRVAEEDYASHERKRQRAERFEATSLPHTLPPTTANVKNGGPIVGLNPNLEKYYLRLTSEPDPRNVRPQHILEKSVQYVLKKYGTLPDKEAYHYLNNQFKSIRQDLTVQHIKNDFAISVYEQNARLALKHDDLGEFNQCSGQLKFLYNYKRQSSLDWSKRFISSEVEMICYKIIYMMITNSNSEICKLKLSLLQDYKGFQRENANVVYFKFIMSLFRLNNYKLTNNCFQFYEELGEYKGLNDVHLALKVISGFLDNKIRLSGLYVICSANRTGMKIESLQDLLSFEDRRDCDAFLRKFQLDTFITKDDFQAFRAKGTVKALYKKSTKIDIKGQI